MAERNLSLGHQASVTEGDLSLPTPPGIIRRFWARHPWLTDSLIVGVYFVPTFFGVLVFQANTPIPDWWVAALELLAVAVTAAALMFRRQHPWIMMVVVWAAVFPSILVNDLSATIFPIIIALYSLAVYASVRSAWNGFAGTAAVGTAANFLAAWIHQSNEIAPFGSPALAASIQFVIIMLVATLIGINVGNRKRYVAALVDRAAQLARERDQQAQLAAAGERARIAREMHDIVSHSLTVMVTLANGSAALAETDAHRSEEAMRQVAETGRQALGDMRRMLGVLNNDGPADAQASSAELAPQPGAGDLTALVERFRTAGLPVRSTVSGVAPLDPGQQLTVYRIAQEALTNALRYATNATTVGLYVRYTASVIEITIDDDGHGRDVPDQGAGRGLIGMRERVALYGGALESGPRRNGGWRVHAEFDRVDGSAE